MTKIKQPERTRSYHHGDLSSALVTAACAMLERSGPEAISFRAIARSIGVSQAAPYNHFDNKEDLLSTVAASGFADLGASQRDAYNAASRGEDRLRALGIDYVHFALKRPQLYRLMFGAGISDRCSHPMVTEAKVASFSPIQNALAEHLLMDKTTLQVETASTAAWALVHGLSMLLIDGSLQSSRRAAGKTEMLAAQVIALFVSGLK